MCAGPPLWYLLKPPDLYAPAFSKVSYLPTLFPVGKISKLGGLDSYDCTSPPVSFREGVYSLNSLRSTPAALAVNWVAKLGLFKVPATLKAVVLFKFLLGDIKPSFCKSLVSWKTWLIRRFPERPVELDIFLKTGFIWFPSFTFSNNPKSSPLKYLAANGLLPIFLAILSKFPLSINFVVLSIELSSKNIALAIWFCLVESKWPKYVDIILSTLDCVLGEIGVGFSDGSFLVSLLIFLPARSFSIFLIR